MARDWTMHAGRSNDSRAFRQIVADVEQTILSSAYYLVRGQTESVARSIVARLAHTWGMAPAPKRKRAGGKGAKRRV